MKWGHGGGLGALDFLPLLISRMVGKYCRILCYRDIICISNKAQPSKYPHPPPPQIFQISNRISTQIIKNLKIKKFQKTQKSTPNLIPNLIISLTHNPNPQPIKMQPRVSQLHNKSPKCLKQYAYFEDKNFPVRKTMQDNYIAIDQYIEKNNGFFAILDGHGGAEVSEFCANCLPNLFEQEYKKDRNDVKGAFQRTMARADDQLKLVGATETGTTCCLVFVKSNGNNKLVHVANLGDTRAVLSSDGTAKRVTIDHKTTNLSQQERIKKQGGLILKGRVAGQLAITRALGDLGLKTQGVSNVPDIETFPVDGACQFLIIASDGLWDVCQDQQAVDMVKNMATTKDMAKALVQYALKNGSQDNVSVLVLKFK